MRFYYAATLITIPLLHATSNPSPQWTFERNVGRVAKTAEWVVLQGASTPLFLRSSGASIALYGPASAHFIEMRFEGASAAAESVGEKPLESYSNYYLGRDASTWFTGVAQFGRVRYRGVYPGIDVVYHPNGRQAEYDFELGPHADPSSIHISFRHIDGLHIAGNGDLILTWAGTELRQQKPRIWQGGRELEGSYRIDENNQVGFAIARYNPKRPATIDPTIQFASYLGGPGMETVQAMTVDSRGFLYIAGSSQSIVTPSLDPFSQSGFIVSSPYIFKFSPDGQRLIFTLTLAVDNKTESSGLAIDSSGNLLLVGDTTALQLPLVNAIDSQFQAAIQTTFAIKWTGDGRSIVYSTYFGGSGNDTATAGAVVDPDGNLYFAGATSSPDLPVLNALQPTFAGGPGLWLSGGLFWPLAGEPLDCFVTKLTPNGQVSFSTYLGGSGDDNCRGIAWSPDGAVVIVGESTRGDFPLVNPISTLALAGPPNLRVSKMASDGQSLLFSTFLPNAVTTLGSCVAVDQAGGIYIGGLGQGLLTKNAFQSDASRPSTFVLKLDSSGQDIDFSTYLDGVYPSTSSSFRSIAFAADGSIYVGGGTNRPDFPVVNPLQPASAFSSKGNLLLAKLSPSGSSLVFSTLLGGSVSGGFVSVGPDGGVFFAGGTGTTNLPVVNAFQPAYGGAGDIFFAKIIDDTLTPVSPFTILPSSLYFDYRQGDPLPPTQNVTVQGPAYSATPDSAWLTATPSDSDQTALQIAADPTSLSPGMYHGSISLQDAAGDTAAIIVTFNVLGTPPRLDSINPNVIAVGSDDTQITFSGAGFDTTTSILIFGAPSNLTPTLIDSSTLVVTLSKSYLSRAVTFQFSVQNANTAASTAIPVSVQ